MSLASRPRPPSPRTRPRTRALALALARVLTLAPALALALSLVACAAPPLGLGTGAHIPTTSGGQRHTGMVAAGAAAVATADHRQAFQAEGSMTAVLARWFSLDLGAVYSQVADDRDHTVFAAGVIGYVRPRLQLGNVSVATAVGGLGFGGGGGGIYGGIADVQVGYGTPTWSAYAGRYEMVFEAVGSSDGSTRTWGLQYRIGAEYMMPVGALKLGVALELYRQRDSLRGGGDTVSSRFVGAGLKLRIESGLFQ